MKNRIIIKRLSHTCRINTGVFSGCPYYISDSNDAHIALQDVPQLGQLIEAGLADKLAHTGNARVVLDLEHGTIHLVLIQQIVQFCLCIGAHGAELIELEGLAVAADALLAENRARRRIVHNNCNRP